LTGEQDYDHRLETDADDAALLIKEFSPNEPATVIGNSSGAIVSLRLLTRHPDIIRTLIPYEPPAAKLIPEFDQIWAKHEETYDLYRKKGPKPALKVFAELTKADQRMIESFDLSKPTIWSNLQYWFEREFMFYPKADFDVECEIRPLKEKLMPIYGESSPKEAYQYRAMEVMCKQLGLEYVGIPGEHVAQATHAPQFAQRLREALKAKDQYYAAL
jgi:pimeloyl-ACP methyl ester carboxylesterase